MTDRYEKIRQALAMGPTPGPFSAVRSYSPGNQELIIRLTCNDEYGITENYCTVRNSLGDTWKTEADAAFIAACDPDTIRALLAERDELAKDAARYRWLRRGGNDDIGVVRGFDVIEYGSSSVASTYEDSLCGDRLDAAIDAAMQRTTAQEGSKQ